MRSAKASVKVQAVSQRASFLASKIGPRAGSVYPLGPHLQSPYSPELAGLFASRLGAL